MMLVLSTFAHDIDSNLAIFTNDFVCEGLHCMKTIENKIK